MKDSHTLADLQNWESDGETPIRLGVVGDPVRHSRSPQMMNAALQASGLALRYSRFQIVPNELSEALELFAQHEFLGVNLTIPHKARGADLMDDLEEFARSAGVVNCVRFEEGKRIGFNTDGPGFARAIRSEFSVDLRDLRVLLLGAGGGAGRAIAWQCAQEGCERLALVNRTFEKAQGLVAELKPGFTDARVSAPVARLEAVPWEERALRHQIANSDLVVNATPMGLKRADASVLSASLLAPHLMIFDTIYEPARTALLAAAAEAGARGVNGLSMLLHQGALSFERWFDREAPLDVMRAALLAV